MTVDILVTNNKNRLNFALIVVINWIVAALLLMNNFVGSWKEILIIN